MSDARYSSDDSESHDDGVEMVARRKMDARKLFEESLQKVTRTGRMDVDSPELLQLLLTSGPVMRPSDVDSVGPGSTRAPDDVVHDVELDAEKTVANTSTDEHAAFDSLAASAGDDKRSVFTSDRLDEYLAKDGIDDKSTEAEKGGVHALGDQDLYAKWNDSTETEKPPLSSRKGDPVQSTRMTTSERPDGRTSEVEFDIIDGFPFYSFTTPDALLQHIDETNQTYKTAVDHGSSRTKKFQYGIAGNMAKYLPKMKGWEKRTSVAREPPDDAADALFSDGLMRQLSDAVVLGLDLAATADDAVMPAGDSGWLAVGRYTRRGVGNMGDEERQPRKGRIYGRKFDGRFASKANIHHHIKRRGSSPTTPTAAVTTDTNSSSSSYSGISVDSSQPTTTLRNIHRLLSSNLQPRVDLTKSIVIPPKISVSKDDNRSSSKEKPCVKNKTVQVKSANQIHLTRLTEAASRRAIVALQLAPSMTNSPMKCNKPSMIHCNTIALGKASGLLDVSSSLFVSRITRGFVQNQSQIWRKTPLIINLHIAGFFQPFFSEFKLCLQPAKIHIYFNVNVKFFSGDVPLASCIGEGLMKQPPF